MIWVANGVVVGGLALILTLDASVQEFTELVSLSDEARRIGSFCGPRPSERLVMG